MIHLFYHIISLNIQSLSSFNYLKNYHQIFECYQKNYLYLNFIIKSDFIMLFIYYIILINLKIILIIDLIALFLFPFNQTLYCQNHN
jgi:hypothetical protein